MLIRSLHYILIIFSVAFIFVTCNRKDDNKKQLSSGKHEFSWKEEINASDIPAFSVKGFLNGQEVKFQYVNFERWHGSNDNVINFSLSKPEHPCGYIENFSGFRIVNKGNAINKGQWSKPAFNSDHVTYTVNYIYLAPDGTVHASDAQWNCILIIENMSEKNVTGKLALCFNDQEKSWLAGSFDAQVCNN